MDKSLSRDHVNPHALVSEVHKNQVSLQKDKAPEYTPKVHIIADYIM